MVAPNVVQAPAVPSPISIPTHHNHHHHISFKSAPSTPPPPPPSESSLEDRVAELEHKLATLSRLLQRTSTTTSMTLQLVSLVCCVFDIHVIYLHHHTI